MATGSNNKANVSTTRGVQGGYAFIAPMTESDVPTDSTWTPSGPGWKCLGYIPQDGFVESINFDNTTSLRDINLDVVDETDGAPTETIRFSLMETAEVPLSAYYGTANVTDAAGELKVEHKWGDAGDEMQYAFLLRLKNDRKWVKHIADGKVTDRGDFTGNKTTAASRQITIKYIADSDGMYAQDFFESTETSS